MTNFLSESASFAELIRQLEGLSVVVLGHRRPDGDCIGSQVALTRILRTMRINAIAVNNDPVPRTLQKFVGDTPFTNPQGLEGGDYKIVTVDCADHARVGDELRKRFPSVFLNVDHHVSNTKFAEHNFVLSDASATGEILAKFFFDSGLEVDQTTADALYLGFVLIRANFATLARMRPFLRFVENFVNRVVTHLQWPMSYMKGRSPAGFNFAKVSCQFSNGIQRQRMYWEYSGRFLSRNWNQTGRRREFRGLCQIPGRSGDRSFG